MIPAPTVIPSRQGHDYAPSIYTILRGIRDGALNMNHARWAWFADTNGAYGGPARPGPLLEVAYWIGRTPGVVPGEQEEQGYQLHTFRDPENEQQVNGRTVRDNWVMFHLHFDPADPHLFRHVTIAGTEEVQISTFSVRMYHGQTSDMYWGGNNRRVANRDTGAGGVNTRSATYTCPRNTRWYLGDTGEVPAWTDNDPPAGYDAALRWFARHLQAAHVLDYEGLNYAWNVDSWVTNNYDTNHVPTPRSRNPRGAAYRDSWVWDQNRNFGQGDYDMDPNIPENP